MSSSKRILIVELLDEDRKVLGLVDTEKLERSNELAFHDELAVGESDDDRSVLFDLILLEELRRNGSANENVNLVVRFESRGHLLVRDKLDNLVSRRIRILVQDTCEWLRPRALCLHEGAKQEDSQRVRAAHTKQMLFTRHIDLHKAPASSTARLRTQATWRHRLRRLQSSSSFCHQRWHPRGSYRRLTIVRRLLVLFFLLLSSSSSCSFFFFLRPRHFHCLVPCPCSFSWPFSVSILVFALFSWTFASFLAFLSCARMKVQSL